MGRKKSFKNGKNNASEEKKEKSEFSIHGDTKRSVAAITFFALALLVILGFIAKAGVVGEALDKIIGTAIGWTKFVFPIFLTMAGVVLLLRKEASFYISKLAGLLIALVALSGFFHWLYAVKEMKDVAAAGSGGGYLGYAVAYGAVKYLEKPGGLVVILALFSIGIVVSFDFPIILLLRKLKEIRERKKEETLLAETETGSVSSEEEKGEVIDEIEEVVQESEENIGNIEFVDGSDRYVDTKLFEKLSSGVDSLKKKIIKPRRSSEEKSLPVVVGDWELPPLDLLELSEDNADPGDKERNVAIIVRKLKDFGIGVEAGEITIGPAVTQYTFRPAVGVKISRILALQNDLALALAARSIRIEAPIPGKPLIGIEIPNKHTANVNLRDIMESQEFRESKSNLTIALGKDVSGKFIAEDLGKMPHLMIAGATGKGKSVAINSIVTSLLYRNSPKDLKFIMVDPKRVELSLYNKIPHLLADVITDNNKVVTVLKWAVGEMEKRYRLMQDISSRDIASYNREVASGRKREYTAPETGEITEEDLERMPHIVIVIDEMADLMASHGKEVEGAIVRLAQLARAVGIHLIVSTQRPEVKVITGLIKANITNRIAFQVGSQIDSRTILDMAGAEKLLGNGDMLYVSTNSSKPKRIQGGFISESEVKKVVEFLIDQKKRKSKDEIEEDAMLVLHQEETLDFKEAESTEGEDAVYEAAKEEVIRSGKASATLLQRRLRIGYPKAARMLDMLEEKGIVGPADGAKPREVYGASANSAQPDYGDPIQDQQKREKWQM
ncbi:MAG TPA: DNA translocase FtsK 4TM domain-containing protein [Patescibacteria group bacterium]